MASDIMDWTNADADKLGVAGYEARASEMADRLKGEIGDNKLPFFSMPFADELLKQLDELDPWLRGFEHMLVLGIGGSALGARALQKAFAPGQDQPGHMGPWLWILDNVDVETLETMMNRLPPERTVVVVISKSGTTIETIGQYFLVKLWLQKALGKAWNDHFLFITDPAKGYLREQADSLGVRTMPVPDNLGGRYSVLSAVGMVPARFMNMDAAGLIRGARDVLAPLADPGLDEAAMAAHPAFQLACWNAALMDAGYSELIYFSYIPSWSLFGNWFAQLWAESLGKEGKGSQPIPAVGVTDQHSVNQMFLDGPRNKACLFLTCRCHPETLYFPRDLPDKWDYLKGKDFGELLRAEALGTRMALNKCKVPLVELRFDAHTPQAVGKMIGLLGAATVLCGWLMGINPVDQPAVELGKRLANAKLGADGLAEEKADLGMFMDMARDERGF